MAASGDDERRGGRPHERPEAAALVVSGMPAGAPLLVARGQYSPRPSAVERVHVIRVAGAWGDGGGGAGPGGDGPCEEVRCAWMAPAEIGALVERLRARGPVREGECDAMYAGPWRYAWTTDGPPFALWEAGEASGPLATAAAGAPGGGPSLRVRGALASGRAVGVHLWLTRDWCDRGVRVLLEAGDALDVASEHDAGPAVDPTFDGLNLLCETSWAVSLGGALAEALRVPLSRDADI